MPTANHRARPRRAHPLNWRRPVAVSGILLLAVLAGGCSGADDKPGSGPSEQPSISGGAGKSTGGNPRLARNVIFIQGDGMGIAHRELIRLATKGRDGELAMNQLAVTGLVHTDPADPKDAVTDSAAAATAFATGVRTTNGSIGVDPSGKSVPNLLELARDAGKSTGLVTTSQITDASPGAFAAHVERRSDQSEIARQMIEQTKVDVLLGGGEDWWYPAGTAGSLPDTAQEQSKSSAGNLVDQATQLGYQHVSTADGLAGVTSGKVLGLFANERMFTSGPEGKGEYRPAVPLPAMATKAIDILAADQDGFFLFVEEEAIDEMAHSANTPLVIKSGAQLDATVAAVLKFAAKTPDTLVLVIGDHETGGLAIEDATDDDEHGTGEQAEDQLKIADSDTKLTVDWTTNHHTGAAVPVTAQGPGSGYLGGIIKNTQVNSGIRKAMGLQ